LALTAKGLAAGRTFNTLIKQDLCERYRFRLVSRYRQDL